MTEAMKVVVIGAVACGAKAASRIRRLDPRARITMIDQGRFISYAGCGLPYFVGGQVRELEELVRTTYGSVRDADYFKRLKDVDVEIATRAEWINLERREVGVRHLDSGGERVLPYDKLVLSLGARPVDPPIDGLDLGGVHHLTRLEEAEEVARTVGQHDGGRAVVVGAGFIGIEATEALVERGWEVTLVERYDQVFPWALDPGLAQLVAEHLFERLVQVETGVRVERLVGENGRVRRVVTSAGEHDADLVILATGVRPNVELARDAGLALGETGALAVDEHLRTSDPHVYAGGDLVENRHLVTGRPCYIPLGSTANKHGRVIADNVCGGDATFPGVAGTFVCKALGLAVGSTGLTVEAAREAGLDAAAVVVPGFDRAHYYPGAAILDLRLVYERGSGRLLGLQGVGAGELARRIDVAASVLRFGGTLDDLAHLDLAYAPPYAMALDCLIQAANAARNEQSGLYRPITPAQVRERLARDNADIVLLDVRSEPEVQRARLEHEPYVHLPLDELAARADELPRDRTLVCLCQLGVRSFTAQRMLEARGFEQVATLDGGLHAWPWKDELV